MRKTMYASGFTLVELLITIAIIGILAGAVFVSLGDEADDADDTAVILGIQSLRAPAKRLQLHRNAPTGTKICQELHGKVRGVGDNLKTWTATATCDGTDLDEPSEICCAAKDREWVIWGRLSSYSPAAGNTDGSKDIYCIDDDDNVGEVDLSGTLAATGSGTFIVQDTSSNPNLKCQ